MNFKRLSAISFVALLLLLRTPLAAAAADWQTCAALADPKSNPQLKVLGIQDDEKLLIFNSSGQLCYFRYPIARGDRLRVALGYAKGESPPTSYSYKPERCTVPTGAVVVVGTAPQIPQSTIQSTSKPPEMQTLAEDKVYPVGPALECDSAEIDVTLTIDNTAAPKQTFQLFARTTAVIHLGVLNSKLRDSDFTLRTNGGTSVIADRETQARGPEYVAMVVLQGLPHYFQKGLAYQGRDLVHETAPADRLGLAFSFGLKDPGKRFGLGLGYEIARGINFVVIHEWLKRSRLDGVSVGDTFSGDIPKTNEWAKGWSVGITFDSAYLSRLFSSSK